MKRFFALTLLVFGISTVSQAGILIEPNLGYGSGSFKTSTSVDESGIGYGAFLAYSLPGFFLGLDLHLASPTYKITPEATGTASAMGFILGLSLPAMPLRAWVTYYFQDSLKLGTPETTYTGTGIKLGGGYMLMPLVSLNLEYFMNTFTKTEPAPSTPVDATESKIFVSVSVPLDI